MGLALALLPLRAISNWLQKQARARGHRWRVPRVDGADHLGVVDSLQVDGRDSEVGVAELSLDHVELYSLVRHLDGVRMAKLMRGDPPSHPGPQGELAQL